MVWKNSKRVWLNAIALSQWNVHVQTICVAYLHLQWQNPRWILPTTPYITFQSHIAYNLLFCIIAKPVLLLISGRVRGPALLTATITVLQWSCYSEGQSGSISEDHHACTILCKKSAILDVGSLLCWWLECLLPDAATHSPMCARFLHSLHPLHPCNYSAEASTVSLFSWVHNVLQTDQEGTFEPSCTLSQWIPRKIAPKHRLWN